MTNSKYTKVDYSNQIINVGIDVHKKSYSVSIYINQQYYKTLTMPPSGKKIVEYLEKHFPNGIYRSTYEAGFSGFSLHRELEDLGVCNKVVTASDVPMSDKEREQKRDSLDARQLGLCLSSGILEERGIYIPSEKQVEDRALLRHRSNLSKDCTRIKNRIKMLLYNWGIVIPVEYDKPGNWSKNFVNWIAEQKPKEPSGQYLLSNLLSQLQQHRQWLKETTLQIRGLSQSSYYKANYDLLISIPGLGLIGAMRFLTELGDITRFETERELSSYAGLIPNSRSSGENQRQERITHRGNKHLKKGFIEAAWTAIRCDPALALCYNKGVEARKKGNKVIVKIARKLLCRARAVLILGIPYQIGVIGGPEPK